MKTFSGRMGAGLSGAGVVLVVCVFWITAIAAAAAQRPSQNGDAIGLERLASIRVPSAEVAAYDDTSNMAFIAAGADVVMVHLGDGTSPAVVRRIPLAREAQLGGSFASGGNVTHLAIDPAGRGIVAACVVPDAYAMELGRVVFLSARTGKAISSVPVGFNPDALAFSSRGEKLVVANEGQPQVIGGALTDPPGSISVVDLADVRSEHAFSSIDASRVATLYFGGPVLGRAVRSGSGVRIHPANAASAGLDLEPEYVTVDGRYAYVSLQENNAVARVDLEIPAIDAIFGLGEIQQICDPSDRDGGANINQRVSGLPMPDQIAVVRVPIAGGERTLIVSANEGDARAEPGEFPLWDHARLKDLAEMDRVGPKLSSSGLLGDRQLGRLHVCPFTGDEDGDDLIDRPVMLGTRSVSVWDARSFERVGDTGSALELALAAAAPGLFNAKADDLRSPDSRSDDRGIEPEGVVAGLVAGRPIVFVSAERPGAIGAVDVSDPATPRLVGFHVLAGEGDLAPEGMVFIDATRSPTGEPLLLAACEGSGTLAVFRVVPAGVNSGGEDGVVAAGGR